MTTISTMYQLFPLGDRLEKLEEKGDTDNEFIKEGSEVSAAEFIAFFRCVFTKISVKQSDNEASDD